MTAGYDRQLLGGYDYFSPDFAVSDDVLWRQKSRLLKMLSKWRRANNGSWYRARFMENSPVHAKGWVVFDSELGRWRYGHGKKTFRTRQEAMAAEDKALCAKKWILWETV